MRQIPSPMLPMGIRSRMPVHLTRRPPLRPKPRPEMVRRRSVPLVAIRSIEGSMIRSASTTKSSCGVKTTASKRSTTASGDREAAVMNRTGALRLSRPCASDCGRMASNEMPPRRVKGSVAPTSCPVWLFLQRIPKAVARDSKPNFAIGFEGFKRARIGSFCRQVLIP